MGKGICSPSPTSWPFKKALSGVGTLSQARRKVWERQMMDQEEERGEGGSGHLNKVRGLCLTPPPVPTTDRINSFVGHLISKQVSGVP